LFNALLQGKTAGYSETPNFIGWEVSRGKFSKRCSFSSLILDYKTCYQKGGNHFSAEKLFLGTTVE
jgi:hypothetical protein